ncbi:hypothetical protein BD626DRAFT_491860 [Schizophyllum amplum]|uniref:Uncharacterized protein n=1 Tax=Schizophyllum amplum TaxID=97359 RepID=A0A550CI29_9AGAR|nr:hypothetical protein BD626DRAFT_491860 [Auriculariopsis ampla]
MARIFFHAKFRKRTSIPHLFLICTGSGYTLQLSFLYGSRWKSRCADARTVRPCQISMSSKSLRDASERSALRRLVCDERASTINGHWRLHMSLSGRRQSARR